MNTILFNSTFLFALTLFSQSVFSQKDTIIANEKVTLIEEVLIMPLGKTQYQYELERLRIVYPLALHAKELIEAYDDEIAFINKKRKKRKFTREAHQKLKDDFYWSIRDMYYSEGQMLMKLVHRETGLTVSDIVKKYRGKVSSGLYENMAKLFDQDLDIKYDPKGEDALAEKIINQINNKELKFDFTPQIKSKAVAKASLKEYRQESREANKEARKDKREARKEKRKK